MLLRIWLGCWLLVLALTLFCWTAELVAGDPDATSPGSLVGLVFLLVVSGGLAGGALFALCRPAPAGISVDTGRTVSGSYPPAPVTLTFRALARTGSVATRRQLDELARAERELGEALYQLDQARAELGVPREAIAATRVAGLALAAAVQRRLAGPPALFPPNRAADGPEPDGAAWRRAAIGQYQLLVRLAQGRLTGAESTETLVRAAERASELAAG